MADAHSTHACEVCGATFTRKLNKDGSERKTRYSVCSAVCRDKQKYRADKAARGNGKATCAACGKGFEQTHGRQKYCCEKCRKSHQSSRNRAPEKRDEKHCAVCGARFFGNRLQKYCGDRCSEHAKRERWRAQNSKRNLGPFNCEHCYQPFYAKKRSEAKFCSRQCAFDRLGIVAEERDALRRIQQKNKRIAVRTRSKVKTESSALRRIASAWRLAKGICHVCGEPYARLRAWQRTCSRVCDAEHARRQVELVRKHRKISKAKRRAISKGVEADSIDPIKVFERDKWRCHICGKKTRKELRGSTHADAPELEHVVSLAEGGAHTWGNVSCSCRACNCKKGAASFGQIGFGFAV